MGGRAEGALPGRGPGRPDRSARGAAPCRDPYAAAWAWQTFGPAFLPGARVAWEEDEEEGSVLLPSSGPLWVSSGSVLVLGPEATLLPAPAGTLSSQHPPGPGHPAVLCGSEQRPSAHLSMSPATPRHCQVDQRPQAPMLPDQRPPGEAEGLRGESCGQGPQSCPGLLEDRSLPHHLPDAGLLCSGGCQLCS